MYTTKGVKTNERLMQVESIAECSLGAFCNTFDLHYAIIGLDKTKKNLSFVEWPLKTVLLMQLSLMGIQFEKLKKKNCDLQLPVKQGRVRGSKNIFKVGLRLCIYTVCSAPLLFTAFIV